MAAAALPVVLKKFHRRICNIEEINVAKISTEFQFIGILDDLGQLSVCSVSTEVQERLSNVKQFEWTHPSGSQIQSCDNNSHHISFVAVKSDWSVELYSVCHCSEASAELPDGITSSVRVKCVAMVTADMLQALLRDRGKEYEVTDVKLVSCTQQDVQSGCSAMLLTNHKLITVLALSQTAAPELTKCFALDSSASSVPLLVPVSSLVQVQQNADLIFSLFSSGILIIHHIDGNFVGWVDIQEFVFMKEESIDDTEFTIFPRRPTFCCCEVAEDLSVLVASDNRNSLYVVNLDEYFTRSPDHFSYVSGKLHRPPGGASLFSYDPHDEDLLLRDPRTVNMSYGDRVWKTELAEVIQSVSQQKCGGNSVGAETVSISKSSYRWFDGIKGMSQQQHLKSNQRENRQTIDTSSRLTGFFAKQHKQNRKNTSTSTLEIDETVSMSCSRTHLAPVIPAAPWMKGYKVCEVFVTGESVLLWLKPILDETGVDGCSDTAVQEFAHGMLCLYSFAREEFSAHGFTEPTVVVKSTEAIHPQYILTATLLAVPAFGVTQDQLVHKVIMYENAAMADSLCLINQWDHCVIPIHALEVALKLRQLDTVAFFLKNQKNVFSCQTIPPPPSPSPSFSPSHPALSPSLSSPPQVGLDTIQIEAVINLLVKAVKYNAKQEHNRHFTSQLLQMTLSYLHGLMEDGAGVLEKERVERHAVRPGKNTPNDPMALKPVHITQDVETSMRFIAEAIVELRQFLANMPDGEGEGRQEVDGGRESAFGVIYSDDELSELFDSWRNKHDLEVIKDAITGGKIPQAQLFFQFERKFREQNFLGTCDGTLSSITSVGLKLMLSSLVAQDMGTAVIMLTNMGRDVNEQLRKICFYTLHRPLRDFLTQVLEARGSLSEEEKKMVRFVHTLEKVYNQQSFDKAKQCLPRASASNWTDLGLLKNSFNLSSSQVLKEFIHTGSLLLGHSYNESSSGGETGYAEVLLEWARTWDSEARERILLDVLFSGAVPSEFTTEFEISAQSLWHYLVSRNDWSKLIGWIRAMALDVDMSRDPSVLYVGQRFAVREGDIIMPPLTPDVYSQFPGCTRVLKDIVLDELTKYGMFTTEQLSDFLLLLRHLCRTQTLFGDTHPLTSMDSQSPYEANQPHEGLDNNGRKQIISVSDFHLSFIEYCIKLKLMNLLYHYMDFYGLGRTVDSIRKLRLDKDRPPWVDMLVKFRLAGMQPEEPVSVYDASLSNSGIVLQVPHPSVSAMLKSGRAIMALATLMYGPGSLSQAIVAAGGPLEDPVWQVHEPLLRKALNARHKLQSALFPLTTSVDGMEPQDVTVYQLLQGNSAFEISRMFGWQPTNELAGKSDATREMPHFSSVPLVLQFAHKEQLTFSYYLRHGRASFAFTAFVSDHLNTRTIPKSRIHTAAKKAYRVAVQNFSEARITCACVAFTEMLGADSTYLRVDIQSANRILSHGGWEGLVDGDSRNVISPKEAIEYEFLMSCGRANRQPTSLLKALERATRSLISKECLDRTSLEANHHWSLVLMFCRVHKMVLSPAYLIDCAKANKWLPFICHAQSAQFPKHQVLEIVEHHFSNSHLREHLHLALKNAQMVMLQSEVDESERRRRRRKSGKKSELQAVTPTRDVRAQFISRVLRQPASSPEVAVPTLSAVPSTQSSSAEDEDGNKLKPKRGSDKDSSSAAEGKSEETGESMLTESKRSNDEWQEKPLDPDDLPDDLCDVLFACQAASVPWRSLLAHAVALHRPLFAVIAACYEEAKPLDCLCTWLYSTLKPEVLESVTMTITDKSQTSDANPNVLSITTTPCRYVTEESFAIHPLKQLCHHSSGLQWRRWKLEDLSSIIEIVVSHREIYAHTLVKAFYIFDPESPMLPFLRFYESFVVHYDFKSCRDQLNGFKKGYNKAVMKSDKNFRSGKINDVVWLERVTGLVTKLMLTESVTSYEQSHLLELLSKAMFGRNFFCKVPNYFKLNRIAEILRNTETVMSYGYLLDEASPKAKEEKDRVLGSLLHHKRFSEARQLARVLEQPEDRITLKEVLHDYEVIQSSLLWDLQQGRLAFWHKADECFRNNFCNPDVAGLFFEKRASEGQLSFTERAKLLSMALKWYSNKAERWSGRPTKSSAELKQMERKIWLYKIRAEIEKEAKFSRSISHVEFLPDDSDFAQDMPTASSSPVASTVLFQPRKDRAGELVQPEAVDAEQDEDAILETEEEMKALEGVIDELLEHCHVTQARKLATMFGHSSQDLDIVLSCIFLAQGTHFVETLDANVRKLLSQKAQLAHSASGSLSPINRRKSGSFILSSSLGSVGSGSDVTEVDWVLIEDILTSMESLAYHCTKGKKCCSRVIICYKIAQSLGLEYKALVQDEPFNVLRSLLASVLDNRFKFADAYIKAFSLDTEKVTAFLARIILQSLRVYTGEASTGENFELIFNASPSCDDISHVIRLCSDHSLLGDRLLETATTLQNVRATNVPPQPVFQLEVELLVRAHDCHTLACNMDGISSVLKHGRLLTTALADTHHYSLMVRLLTGVGRFHEMSYVFETLLKHHHFELLCRRGIDKENKLKVALLDYLKRYHPDDTEKYTMVAHHFSMYREIAENLENSAVTQLKTLKDYVIAATPDLQAKLNSVMKSFCYACDNYAKDGCQRHSQSCLKQARLVQLQIQLLPYGVRVINLDDHDLQRFLEKHGHFFEALLVADAYNKRGYSVWVDAVYTHVVVGGDFKYFHELKSAISLSSVLFVDVVNKYKNEGVRSSQITVNLKKLLTHVMETRIRYRLATDLNFRDVASSILEGDGGSYLRDIMAP